MDIRQLGDATLAACRVEGWASLETGVSRPVPRVTTNAITLAYLLYRSQVRPPYQLLYEPIARVTVDIVTGSIIEHVALQTGHPPRMLGRYPHAAAAHIPREQWSKVWDDLFALYPSIIRMFAGQMANDSVQRASFVTLFDLTTPPFLRSYYVALNPPFFDWLAG